MELSPLRLIDKFPALQPRWNNNIEIIQILESARLRADWLTTQVKERPPSGSQILFERRDGVYFKGDGYEWRRRKEGRLIREDHMKLKVNKMELISANYAHSAVVPTFHRRVYWLTSKPDIVLVHYLNCPEEDSSSQLSLPERMADLLRRTNLSLSFMELVAQACPIFSHHLSVVQVQSLCRDVHRLLGSECHASAQPPSSLSRRNSCSSASRRGLSSLALARQPSAFSDSIDANFLSAVDSNCARDKSNDEGSREEDPVPSDWSALSPPACSTSEWSAAVPSPFPVTGICPKKADVKGGERLLVVGGWYLRGHEYNVLFGERSMRARLLQVGVLEVDAPPASSTGHISVRVSCDGVVVSSPVDFFYVDESPFPSLLQSLIDRVHLVAAAFNVLPNFSGVGGVDECGILRALHGLQGRPLLLPSILGSTSRNEFPSRTLLHLAASLDFVSVIEFLLFWKPELPTNLREFDTLARDASGRTPLDIAVAAKHSRSVVALSRGMGVAERVEESVASEVVDAPGPSLQAESVEHAASTALWVLTDGCRVTAEEGAEESAGLPLEISIDTHVVVPDSPSMAHLFEAVTSPGLLDGGTRQKMALLARQIIDALPQNIKSTQMLSDYEVSMQPPPPSYLGIPTDYYSYHQPYQAAVHPIQTHQQMWMSSYGSAQCSSRGYDTGSGSTDCLRRDSRPEPVASSFLPPSLSACSLHSLDVEMQDKELGEFFSLNTVDSREDIDPLQQQLDNLKLSAEEQREVYQAALLMEADAHSGGQIQPKAALTMQSCYRKYKQFSYLRRLHRAASVVQKHFRLRRLNQREETHEEQVQERPSCDGKTICIQVPNGSLLQHRAAATIQNAYRGHRKRQAAARLIQKFIRQTRQKLRKNHEASDVASTPSHCQGQALESTIIPLDGNDER